MLSAAVGSDGLREVLEHVKWWRDYKVYYLANHTTDARPSGRDKKKLMKAFAAKVAELSRLLDEPSVGGGLLYQFMREAQRTQAVGWAALAGDRLDECGRSVRALADAATAAAERMSLELRPGRRPDSLREAAAEAIVGVLMDLGVPLRVGETSKMVVLCELAFREIGFEGNVREVLRTLKARGQLERQASKG